MSTDGLAGFTAQCMLVYPSLQKNVNRLSFSHAFVSHMNPEPDPDPNSRNVLLLITETRQSLPCDTFLYYSCNKQCCGTGTGTGIVGTVTFFLVEPEPEPEL